MTGDRVLGLSEAVALASVITACQRNARVQWWSGADVLEGTMRSVGDERGNYLAPGEDVRDGFVRITATTGFEYFVPMAQVLHLLDENMLALG